MKERLKLNQLKLDYDLYPREHVDNYHVRELVEALEAEANFPPILIDAKTKRVIDGFHRVEAFRRVWGDDALIEAEAKEYASEADMFADAMEANSKHGRGLSPYDKARSIAKAETLGITLDKVSSLLQLTVDTVKEMKQERFAYYQTKLVALKRSAMHLAGQELDEEQMNYARKAGGLNQGFYINQVIAMLESDSLDDKNERVMNLLRKLYELLGGKVNVKV